MVERSIQSSVPKASSVNLYTPTSKNHTKPTNQIVTDVFLPVLAVFLYAVCIRWSNWSRAYNIYDSAEQTDPIPLSQSNSSWILIIKWEMNSIAHHDTAHILCSLMRLALLIFSPNCFSSSCCSGRCWFTPIPVSIYLFTSLTLTFFLPYPSSLTALLWFGIDISRDQITKSDSQKWIPHHFFLTSIFFSLFSICFSEFVSQMKTQFWRAVAYWHSQEEVLLKLRVLCSSLTANFVFYSVFPTVSLSLFSPCLFLCALMFSFFSLIYTTASLRSRAFAKMSKVPAYLRYIFVTLRSRQEVTNNKTVFLPSSFLFICTVQLYPTGINHIWITPQILQKDIFSLNRVHM